MTRLVETPWPRWSAAIINLAFTGVIAKLFAMILVKDVLGILSELAGKQLLAALSHLTPLAAKKLLLVVEHKVDHGDMDDAVEAFKTILTRHTYDSCLPVNRETLKDRLLELLVYTHRETNDYAYVSTLAKDRAWLAGLEVLSAKIPFLGTAKKWTPLAVLTKISAACNWDGQFRVILETLNEAAAAPDDDEKKYAAVSVILNYSTRDTGTTTARQLTLDAEVTALLDKTSWDNLTTTMKALKAAKLAAGRVATAGVQLLSLNLANSVKSVALVIMEALHARRDMGIGRMMRRTAIVCMLMEQVLRNSNDPGMRALHDICQHMNMIMAISGQMPLSAAMGASAVNFNETKTAAAPVAAPGPFLYVSGRDLSEFYKSAPNRLTEGAPNSVSGRDLSEFYKSTPDRLPKGAPNSISTEGAPNSISTELSTESKLAKDALVSGYSMSTFLRMQFPDKFDDEMLEEFLIEPELNLDQEDNPKWLSRVRTATQWIRRAGTEHKMGKDDTKNSNRGDPNHGDSWRAKSEEAKRLFRESQLNDLEERINELAKKVLEEKDQEEDPETEGAVSGGAPDPPAPPLRRVNATVGAHRGIMLDESTLDPEATRQIRECAAQSNLETEQYNSCVDTVFHKVDTLELFAVPPPPPSDALSGLDFGKVHPDDLEPMWCVWKLSQRVAANRGMIPNVIENRVRELFECHYVPGDKFNANVTVIMDAIQIANQVAGDFAVVRISLRRIDATEAIKNYDPAVTEQPAAFDQALRVRLDALNHPLVGLAKNLSDYAVQFQNMPSSPTKPEAVAGVKLRKADPFDPEKAKAIAESVVKGLNDIVVGRNYRILAPGFSGLDPLNPGAKAPKARVTPVSSSTRDAMIRAKRVLTASAATAGVDTSDSEKYDKWLDNSNNASHDVELIEATSINRFSSLRSPPNTTLVQGRAPRYNVNVCLSDVTVVGTKPNDGQCYIAKLHNEQDVTLKMTDGSVVQCWLELFAGSDDPPNSRAMLMLITRPAKGTSPPPPATWGAAVVQVDSVNLGTGSALTVHTLWLQTEATNVSVVSAEANTGIMTAGRAEAKMKTTPHPPRPVVSRRIHASRVLPADGAELQPHALGGRLRVAVYSEFFPVAYRKGAGGTGKLCGLDVELIEGFCRSVGLKPQFVRSREWLGTWEAPGLWEKRVDVAIGGIGRGLWRTSPTIEWTVPYFTVRRTVVYNLKDPIRRFPEDVTGVVAGTMGSTGMNDAIDRLGKKFGRGEAWDHIEARDGSPDAKDVKDLLEGKIQGLMRGSFVGKAIVAKHPRRLGMSEPWDARPRSLGPYGSEVFASPCRRGSGLAAQLNTYLLRLSYTGELEALVEKHGM